MLQDAFPLKVKNTFIDVDDKYVEFGLDDQDFLKANAMRQVSEPTPQTFLRQVSAGTAMPRTSKPSQHVAFNEVVQEEVIEPEMEPRRQHSDIDQDTEPGWGRMVTGDRLDNFGPAQTPAVALIPGFFDMQGAMDVVHFVPGVQAPNVMAMQGGCMEAAMSRASYVVGFQPTPYGHADDASESAVAMACSVNSANMPQPPKEWEHTLTVMMRNLPNKYNQQMLLDEINNAGFRDAFDFLYLPVDPETNANKGYAFINFVEPSLAWMFKNAFEGRKMERFRSHKFVSVMPAALQGFEANHAHYSGARVSRGDPNTRPLFLREPQQTPITHGSSAHSPQRRRRRGGRVSLIDQAAQRAEVSKRQGGDAPKTPRGTTSATPTMPGASALPIGPGAGFSIKFCPYCGGKVQQGFQFCQYCGNALPHE